MTQLTGTTRRSWWFVCAAACFALFFANVVMGGPLKMQPFLSDVQEMLALLVSVSLFVFGTLALEAKSAASAPGQTE